VGGERDRRKAPREGGAERADILLNEEFEELKMRSAAEGGEKS